MQVNYSRSPLCRAFGCIMLYDNELDLWRCTRACLSGASNAEMGWWLRWNAAGRDLAELWSAS